MATHTISYCTDKESYAGYYPMPDCCDKFVELYNKSMSVINKGFALSVNVMDMTGDGHNDPLQMECEADDIIVKYCPFCGARLVIGADVVEDKE